MPDSICSISHHEDDNAKKGQPSGRISVPEIARHLKIGRIAVYKMLEQGVLPGLLIGRRWLITRRAFEIWERTCGTQTRSGFPVAEEVQVSM